MIIRKECYDCGEDFSIHEEEVFAGLVARPVDEERYKKIWLCENCRKDAEESGEVCEEEIDIVDYDERMDP